MGGCSAGDRDGVWNCEMYIREREEMQLKGLWVDVVQVTEMMYGIVKCT